MQFRIARRVRAARVTHYPYSGRAVPIPAASVRICAGGGSRGGTRRSSRRWRADWTARWPGRCGPWSNTAARRSSCRSRGAPGWAGERRGGPRAAARYGDDADRCGRPPGPVLDADLVVYVVAGGPHPADRPPCERTLLVRNKVDLSDSRDAGHPMVATLALATARHEVSTGDFERFRALARSTDATLLLAEPLFRCAESDVDLDERAALLDRWGFAGVACAVTALRRDPGLDTARLHRILRSASGVDAVAVELANRVDAARVRRRVALHADLAAIVARTGCEQVERFLESADGGPCLTPSMTCWTRWGRQPVPLERIGLFVTSEAVRRELAYLDVPVETDRARAAAALIVLDAGATPGRTEAALAAEFAAAGRPALLVHDNPDADGPGLVVSSRLARLARELPDARIRAASRIDALRRCRPRGLRRAVHRPAAGTDRANPKPDRCGGPGRHRRRAAARTRPPARGAGRRSDRGARRAARRGPAGAGGPGGRGRDPGACGQRRRACRRRRRAARVSRPLRRSRRCGDRGGGARERSAPRRTCSAACWARCRRAPHPRRHRTSVRRPNPCAGASRTG